jgi:type IV pilus assembly protein PilO
MALDLKKLNDLPWYTQLGIFLCIGCILAGMGYYFFITGLQEQINIRQKQLDGFKVEIQRGQAVEQKHLEFKTQNQRLLTKLATLKIILPEAKQTDDLLRQIQSSAVSSGLTIKLFQPMAVVQKDFFSEWPISMDVEGNYHNLGIFFDRLSKLSRIVNVSNVKIVQSNVHDNAAHTIRASYTATTFVYNDTAPDQTEDMTKNNKGAAKAK